MKNAGQVDIQPRHVYSVISTNAFTTPYFLESSRVDSDMFYDSFNNFYLLVGRTEAESFFFSLSLFLYNEEKYNEAIKFIKEHNKGLYLEREETGIRIYNLKKFKDGGSYYDGVVSLKFTEPSHAKSLPFKQKVLAYFIENFGYFKYNAKSYLEKLMGYWLTPELIGVLPPESAEVRLPKRIVTEEMLAASIYMFKTPNYKLFVNLLNASKVPYSEERVRQILPQNDLAEFRVCYRNDKWVLISCPSGDYKDLTELISSLKSSCVSLKFLTQLTVGGRSFDEWGFLFFSKAARQGIKLDFSELRPHNLDMLICSDEVVSTLTKHYKIPLELVHRYLLNPAMYLEELAYIRNALIEHAKQHYNWFTDEQEVSKEEQEIRDLILENLEGTDILTDLSPSMLRTLLAINSQQT